ncbi:hypothetical protein M9458_020465, partial [Cirrhinus mrigala]
MFLKEEIMEERESVPHQPEEILSYQERFVRMDIRRESAAEDVKIIKTEVSQEPEPSFELIKTKEIPEMKWPKQEMHTEKKERKLEMSSVRTSPEVVVALGVETPQKRQEIMPDKKKTTKDMPLQKRTSPEVVVALGVEAPQKRQEIMPDKKKTTKDMPLQKRTSPEVVVALGVEAPQKRQEIMPDKKKATKDMPLQKKDDTPRKEMAIQREIEVHKKESIHLQ